MNLINYFNVLNLVLPAIACVLFYIAYKITKRASFIILMLPTIYWFIMYVIYLYSVHFGIADADDYWLAFQVLLWFIGLCLIVFALSEILARREVNSSIDEICNGKYRN